MLERLKSYFDQDEQQFAARVTGGLHLLILIIALLYQIHFMVDARPSYIEVTLGEFQSGMQAEFAEQQPEEVATRPNPSETEPEEVEPDVPEPEEVPEPVTEDPARQVDLADEVEPIEADPIETPDTDQINPEASQVQEEEPQTAPPVAQEDEQTREGEELSGDVEGLEGDVAAVQGLGQDEDLSSPYDLRWEGELNRSPMVQPLPENSQGVEAVITVRFEVFPNGSVGRIVPVRKMNPELEREVLNTLRNWRFSRLPSGAPQEAQWGLITFRFVLD